jgi:chemotaxis signal transduction protein
MESSNVLCVNVSRVKYGINAATVKEIIPYQKITPLPMQSTLFFGVILHRGKSIPVLNMQKKISLKEPLKGEGYIIILSNYGEDKALWVDAVEGISTADIKPNSTVACTQDGLINIIDNKVLH